MLAGPSAGVSVSSRSRKRTTALNARSFASCSGKSRSIASAPTSPTPRRYDSSRASRCDRTSSAPVTVWSSPPPWCSRSSTWLSGSRRPPNRDFVLRTPFATAPIRPRSRVYRWSTRSASPRRKERSTTASVLYERPATWLKCRDGSGRESTRRFRVWTRMPRIQKYTTRWCGYCVRAKTLLDARGLEYEEISLDDDPAFRQRLLDLTGGWTVPQILIDGRPIGGYTELWQLDRAGKLEQLAA